MTTSKNFNGYAINFENFKLFLLAYTFGKISPISKIKNVIRITSIKNMKSTLKKPRFSSEDTPLNNVSLREANNITMAIFIKLFAINIVANNFFGCFKSSIIISNEFDLLSFASSKSFCVSEKSATSAPDISAEQIKSTSNPMIPVVKVLFKRNIKLRGSGSNYSVFCKLIIMVNRLVLRCIQSLWSLKLVVLGFRMLKCHFLGLKM